MNYEEVVNINYGIELRAKLAGSIQRDDRISM
jgi:hypothetical protein